jgi:hypothetical protein
MSSYKEERTKARDERRNPEFKEKKLHKKETKKPYLLIFEPYTVEELKALGRCKEEIDPPHLHIIRIPLMAKPHVEKYTTEKGAKQAKEDWEKKSKNKDFAWPPDEWYKSPRIEKKD